MRCLRPLSLVGLATLGASASAVFFGVANVSEKFYLVTTDNVGNVYVGGNTTTGPTTDLLVASFTSAGLPRWNSSADGGLSVYDFPLSLVVHNANVNLSYETISPPAPNSYGTQVLNRVTGALGVQTTFTPASPLARQSSQYVQNQATMVGSRNIGGFVDAYALRFDGINPPSAMYYGTSGYTIFRDIVTNLSGSYIVGLDAAGDFIGKWDHATGTFLWRTTLPAGVYPSKIAADGIGNLYVSGHLFNATRDIAICKYSSAGVLLAQGSGDSGGGYDDVPYELAIMDGNKPVVAGYRQFGAGAQTILAMVFNSNLTMNYAMTDNPTSYAQAITTDANNAYILSASIGGVDSTVYKIGAGGVFWGRLINQSASTEMGQDIIYKSGMLLVCGYAGADAFVNRIDPLLGGITW